jgi:DNA polymerase I-like protein with 3'-5' exonuclease and polymerase domains
MDVDLATAKEWRDTYTATYQGVPMYWQLAIERAQRAGYATTWADRRFGLDRWVKEEDRWATESNAINHPIQGAGADQKELAIAMLYARLPELEFGFDLHDGLFYYVPEDRPGLVELILEAKHLLDNLPYEKMWGWKPSIPLPWDASYGRNWGEMRKVA